MDRNLENIKKKLEEIHFPSTNLYIDYAAELIKHIQTLFFHSDINIEQQIKNIHQKLEQILFITRPNVPVDKIKNDSFLFIQSLPSIKQSLVKDIEKAYKDDPSATGYEEIIVAYPGPYAILGYRIAHKLYELNYPIVARTISEYIHRYTAIDIHPGATIGDSFFIDHGTGVVIGETAVIGNNVSIYHGVTLGVLSFDKDNDGNIVRGTKRHPTIEDNVTIYANSMILGGNTIIGHDSIIGSRTVVASSVPPYSKLINKKTTY